MSGSTLRRIAMRILPVILMIIFITLFIACQKDKEKEKETEQIIQGMEEKTASGTLPSFSNEYLASVYESQELIKIDGDNPDLRKKYCDQAYNKEQALFVSMGIARLHHPETGQAIPQYLYERAARMDAMRWAGYGEKWLRNNYQPPFGKLEAVNARPVEVINTAIIGDSLFIFVGTRFSLE